MDYKEKYEQALENLNKIKNANKDNKALVDFIEYEYPELKESEDEKIRKDIIKVFTGEIGFTTKEEAKKYIAWLEKQGVQSLEKKVNEAMREVEEKAKAFTAKHKGETSEEILAQMRGEQKPSEWSEEDEKMWKNLLFLMEQENSISSWEECYEWLKSLKQRMIDVI